MDSKTFKENTARCENIQTMGPMYLRKHHLFLFLTSLFLMSYSEAFAASTFSPYNRIQRGGSLSASTEIKADSSESGQPKPTSIKLNNSTPIKGFGLKKTKINGNQRTNAADAVVINSQSNQDRTLPCHYIAETNLPTDVGHFRLRAYRVNDSDHQNLVKNKFVGNEPCVIYYAEKPPFGDTTASNSLFGLRRDIPVRIHDQCLTSEVFGSKR